MSLFICKHIDLFLYIALKSYEEVLYVHYYLIYKNMNHFMKYLYSFKIIALNVSVRRYFIVKKVYFKCHMFKCYKNNFQICIIHRFPKMMYIYLIISSLSLTFYPPLSLALICMYICVYICKLYYKYCNKYILKTKYYETIEVLSKSKTDTNTVM